MPFEITPTPAPAANTPPGTPPTFLQWKSGGEPLGDPNVIVVDFLPPLVATRGVGEHENVITVRVEGTPPPHVTVALTGVAATGAVGSVAAIGPCVFFGGPYLFRDDFVGGAQSLSTYTHDQNAFGAANWTTSTISTDGAGHAVVPPNSSAFITMAPGYPRSIGFRINAALTTAVEKSFLFGLSTGIEGTVEDTDVELFFPFTEESAFAAFDWDTALGKEVVIEYIATGTGTVNVYICGTLVSSVDADNQMNAMSFIRIGRSASLTGDVVLDYFWLA